MVFSVIIEIKIAMRKIQFIDQLQEGDRFDDVFVVKSSRLAETRAGKPYLVLEVADKSGEIGGPVWNDAERYAALCQVGAFIRLKGKTQSYRDKLQLSIEIIQSVDKSEISLADFVASTRFDIDEMAAEVQKVITTVENKWIRKLLKVFFQKGKIWDQFQSAPAAKALHHAYIGGLMEHCLSMAKLADMLADHYDQVDRSLLMAGVFFHDIGKLQELSEDVGLIDYTTAGRLKGHLVIGSEIVAEEALKIKDFPHDLLVQIQHLILSHHGKLEFGSPTVPMTPEAFILNFIDEIDSKMNLIDQLRRKQKGDSPQWTDYQRSLERYLLVSPYEETQTEIMSDEQVHVQKKLF